MNIFVSYTIRDKYITQKLLESVESALKKFGSPYIDLIHNDSTDKQKRVVKELVSSELLLLLRSESINDSKWALWELKHAQRNNIPCLEVGITEKDSHIDIINKIIWTII